MVRHALTTFPDAADPFQERPDAHSGLDFAYERGRVRDDNTISNVAAGTVALTDAATNFVEVTGAGAVSANTSGFTAGRIPLYEVVTSGALIDAVTDRRTPFMPPGAGGDSGASLFLTDADATGLTWHEGNVVTVAAGSYHTIFDIASATELVAGAIYGATLGVRLTIDGTVVFNRTTQMGGRDSTNSDIFGVFQVAAKAEASMKLELYNYRTTSSDFGWRVGTR